MLVSRIVFGVILLGSQTFAQPRQKGCSCALLLQESVQKVSTIYAGFTDKVNSQTRMQYNQLLNRLKVKASRTNTERGCYEIIKQYTAWFKDMHVGIWFSINSSASALRKVNVNILPKSFGAGDKSLEGLWSTADQRQQYEITKDPSGVNKFIAVTLASTDSAWQPGMVKAEIYEYDARNKFYKGMFYQTNFKGVLNGFTLTGNRIDNWFGPSWYRKGSGNGVNNIAGDNLEPVQFKVLNKDFVYLKLGRFMQWYVSKFDSTVQANRSIIYNTRNLIIDLRGNPGGDGSSSQEMIQLIYTNPVIYPAWQYRSSPEIIESTKNQVAELSKNDPYKLLKREEDLLQKLTANPGQLVSTGDSIVRTVDSIAHFPEHVAFLIDGGSGSSSEFFTFEGKQSKKVTLFGTNTAGVMDYGEDQSFNLSCGQYILAVPWGRNGWIERFGFRIDNIGFKPDVPIPSTEKDWPQFVMKYWSK